MLTPKELEIVEELCSSLSDVNRKKALNNLLFEYRQYMRCRSPEECAQRKEWMQMSYEDIRENFNNTVKASLTQTTTITRELKTFILTCPRLKLLRWNLAQQVDLLK